MNDQDLYGGLTKEEHEVYQEEARQKWGSTEAFKESQRRVSKFTKKDWDEIKKETDSILRGLVVVMDKDVSDSAVQKIIERHHQSINRFYDCTLEIYSGLARMYIADDRFAKFYRRYHQNLPEFLSKAMLYYCDNKKTVS